MPPKSVGAFEDWMSLYSDVNEAVWNKENRELRKISMLICSLNREFKRIENGLNAKVQCLKEQIVEKENLKSNLQYSLHSSKTETSINKSPKLNRRHKNLQLKRSPPVKIQSEKNNLNVAPVLKSKLSSEDLFETSVSEASLEDIKSDNDEFDFELQLNANQKPADANVIDSSFFVQQTPHKPLAKKARLARNATSKEATKILNTQQTSTLTQLFSLNSKKENIPKSSRTDKNHMQQVLSLQDEANRVKHNVQIQEKFLVPSSFIKDFNRIPIEKTKGPKYVHKTETVRCKADRKKLPGWFCGECKAYYEGSNLSPEELQRKMDACSKHRNRFPLSDETIAGFWDVAMPDTQETLDDITVITSFQDSQEI